ncbi:MAG TPA: hypothetical protein DEF45_10590 [Rhodopirellula sp.]|nr:hypothetical protein [Rhodopirellula sp.]
MDRVKQSRKRLPASLVAFAMVTLLSYCRADAPDSDQVLENAVIQKNAIELGVQRAVGGLNSEENVIQQVVGKQLESRKTRPGLFQVLAGSEPRGDSNHQHENMAQSESKGLLDVLFSKNSKSVAKKSSSSNGTQKPRTTGKTVSKPKSERSRETGFSVVSPLFSLELGIEKSPAKATASSKSSSASSTVAKTTSNSKSKPDRVNWDGIPYHSASAGRKDTEPQPIRDPTAAEMEDGGMRIIRGGSRTIAAQAASKRETLASESGASSATMDVPQPPRDIQPLPATRSFSNTSSSRRSNRRTLQPLAQQSNKNSASTASLPQKVATETEVEKSAHPTDDLVPRVANKTSQKSVATNASSEAAAPAPVNRKVVSKDLVKGNPQSKPEAQDTVPTKAAGVDIESVVESGSPRVVPRRPATITKVPSQEIATRVPTAAPVQAGESQTAVAAIGAPLVETPAKSGDASLDGSTNQGLPAVPTPVNPSVLKVPSSVAGGPVSPEKPKVSNVPSIATFPKITAKTDAKSENSFPEPVLAPSAVVSPKAAYTVPVSPAVTNNTASAPVLGAPAAAASHRAGPPRNAFDSTAVESQPAEVSQPSSRIAASAPIGSGIAAGIRTPLRTNGVDADPKSDRSAFSNDAIKGRSETSVPSFGLNASRIRQPVSEIPTAETFGGNPNRIATNFDRSSDGRNMMRTPGAATGLTNSTSELPGIRVATFGPSEVTIRQVNEYEIRVENRGAIDARGVIVRASIPDWAEMKGQNVTTGNVNADSNGKLEHLVWTIDRLPAGTSEKMFIRLIAARSGSYGLDVDWTMQPQKSVAKVRVHEPRLDLSIEGPDQVIYGMSQTYKVRVLNPGDGTAPNVVFTLSPNSATPQTQRIGDIPAGKEAQFDVELTAQDLGDLKIHGLASADLELRSEASKTIRVAAAKLEAVLSGPQLKYQNTEAMYGLQLQNNGSAASENVIATLRLPAGVKYLGGMEGVVAQGNILQWRLSSLKPGEMQNYQFRCQMTSTGEHVFAFECAGTAAGMTDVSIATRVESIADLVLTVSDPPAPAPIGSDVTYEIVIRNRGSKEATNVGAVAQFGHGIEPKRIEGHTGEVVPGQVMFNAIPRIGAGAEVRLRVIAQAEKAGHHRFRAEVHSGDTMLVAEEATHYMSSQSDRVSRRSSDAGSR